MERSLDPTCTIALDPLPDFERHRTLILTQVTTAEARGTAHALLAAVQRGLATIVNIAANIAQRGIASVTDIEDAVKLGRGYPHGPLSWGDRIGGDKVRTILRNTQTVAGDPRYWPSPWLARRVGLGLSLLTPEAARG